MQSFSRGWSFLKQAWGMAFKDKDLLKPSVYALIVGLIVSVIGIIPIIIVAVVVGGDNQIGRVIMGFFGVVLMFAQFVVTYVFSAMTIHLIYGYLTKGDARMDEAWAIVRRDFLDIVTLAAVSTLVGTLRSMAQNNRKNSVLAGILRTAMRAVEALWTEAALLVLPAMVIDDLNFKNSLARIVQITKDNLLLIGISTVGVRWVTGLIGFVFTMIGLVIAIAVGGGIAYVGNASTALVVVGIAIGAMIFFTFIMVSALFSSYTTTAYHTCLYIWARDVEKAHVEGRATQQIAAPAPLAAALA
jgi:membrane-anchored glycerophosphoryl diester phosphodiesterase (GDPDase)